MTARRGRRRGLSFLLAAAIGLAACSESSPPTSVEPPLPGKPSVRMFAPADSVNTGVVFRLEPPPPAGIIPPGDTIPRWSSSDTLVAIVDSIGEVVTIAAGSATITAEFDQWKAETELEVVLYDPAPTDRFASGALGTGRVCAIREGDARVLCSGAVSPRNRIAVAERPGAQGIRFQKVSSSSSAVCALSEAGRLYCWGANSSLIFARRGYLPTDTGPIEVGTTLRFSDFTHNGHAQTCGIEVETSVVYCWGHNDGYQLLNGTPTHFADTILRPIVGEPRAQAVTTAHFHTCFVDLNGRAMCGGSNRAAYGWLGARDSVPLPVAGTQRFVRIEANERVTCGLEADGRAWCWGKNDNGAIGDPTAVEGEIYETPRPVAGGHRFRDISLGFSQFACGVTTEDRFVCWGALPSVWRAQTAPRFRQPYDMAPGQRFRAISPHGCAITVEGRMRCI